MKVKVRPSTVYGSINTPPSKSMTHRALIFAALANGKSIIRNPLNSDDTDATAQVLERLSVNVTRDCVWKVDGGHLSAPFGELNCGESGTTLRLMTALCALVADDCRLIGGPSLSSRPIGPLLDALTQIGVHSESSSGFPPITVKGIGHIKGGSAKLPGNISSQFVSALLTIAPYADTPVDITLMTKLESRPYVKMTLEVMGIFNVNAYHTPDMMNYTVPLMPYRATNVIIEGDWSSAAYLLAAGALAGETRVFGLNPLSSQADKAIISLLKEMNAETKLSANAISVKASKLRGINTNLSDCPDLFPIIATLCAASKGVSRLTGLTRLQLKESDRVAAMAEGLRRMGVEISYDTDTAIIRGGNIHGAEVDPWGDHRIAMSLATLALFAEGDTTILNAECVSKSYPRFWSDFAAVGGVLKSE